MNQKHFTLKSITLICLSILLFGSMLSAQAPILLYDTFDTAPTLASTKTADAWYPDRYPPTIYEQFDFTGENVLHVGIRLADAYENRPLANQNTFGNTQGRKYDLSSGNGFNTALVADLFVGADWETKHRMATIWSSAKDPIGDVSFYNYFGFRNATGDAPGFYVYGYHNIGEYTLIPYSITYGEWYSLKVELTDTAFVYYINDTVVLSDTTLNSTTYFGDLMLQAYNFADPNLPPENQSFEEYDIYWDNVGVLSDVVVFTNPSPVALETAGNYRALAGTALSIGAACTVNGNVGGASVSNSGTVTGTIDVANAAVTTAQNHLTNAIADAQSRTADSLFAVVDLGGMVLGRGVYVGTGTLSITGTLTLQGTSTDIFIIRTGSPGTSLITTAGSNVNLIGGTLPSNVFWQTGTTTTLGTNSNFKGNILAGTAIVLNADATIDGKALSLTTVTLNGSAVLPVELVSFTATAHRMNADLNWSTATEVNNFGFEVQRTMMNDELGMMNWSPAGFVEGAGTSSSPKEYSFTDKNLSSGKYSYRLKQIDRDGQFTYSQSVEVIIDRTPTEFALMQNYPNPFNPSTTIQYSVPVSSHVSLKVFNLLGQEVAALVNVSQEAGNYSVPFNSIEGAFPLSSGVYIYRLEAGSFIATKKLTLTK